MDEYEGPFEVRIVHTNGQRQTIPNAHVAEGMTVLVVIDEEDDKIVFPLVNVLYYELIAEEK